MGQRFAYINTMQTLVGPGTDLFFFFFLGCRINPSPNFRSAGTMDSVLKI